MNVSCKDCPYVSNLANDIKEHKKTLDRHEDDISDLKADGREYKIGIKNLCKQVSNLVTTLKWFIGIWVTSLLGFFFYAIQNHILK